MKGAVLSLFFASPVSGMIFFDAASMPANTETAPTGPYANSGWQFQIVTTRQNGGEQYLGTIISPKHYLTAAHVGLGSSGTMDREIIIQPSYITCLLYTSPSPRD